MVIGYPSWHPKVKKFPQKKFDRNQSYKGKPKGIHEGKIAANVRTGNVSLTQSQIEQLQQLLKLLPQSSQKCEADIEEELDTNFAGMILCFHAGVNRSE